MLRKIRNSFLLGVLFLFAFTSNVFALIDINQVSSIDLNYQYDEKSIEGAVVSLYKIASVDSIGNYSYISPFTSRTEDLNSLSASATRTLASELSSVIKEDQIAYNYQKNSTKTGHVQFDSLTPGVYLVLTDEVIDSGEKYQTLPFFVSIPQIENGNYIYDVAVDVKIEAEVVPTPTPTPSISPSPTPTPTHNTIFSPSTYDDIVIYVSIFAVCIIGVGIVVYYIVQKNKKEKINKNNLNGKEDGSKNEK